MTAVAVQRIPCSGSICGGPRFKGCDMQMSDARFPELRSRAMTRPSLGLPFIMLSLLANSAAAEVIWRGDFETGTTEQWRGAPKSDSVKVVTEPVRAGKYALRIDG